MISNTLFITYTLMCFFSLQAITLILIVLKHKSVGSTKPLKAMRNFIIVSIVLGLFYYITYYRELVLGIFATNVFLRGLDAVIFYAMGHSWVKLIDGIIDSKNPKMENWRKYTDIIFFALMLLSAISYIFLLDEYYATDYLWSDIAVIGLEVILGIVVIVFTTAYVALGYRELTDGTSKKYIVSVSVLINFNNVWNNVVVIFVFLQAVRPSVQCTLLYGVTSILLLVVNLLTVLYLYKKDFSPIFSVAWGETGSALSEQDMIDVMAKNHRLTEREREVLLLAYQGLSNPDIADKLYISRHTVKRHMHNIFEKFGVSSRMELIRLIQSETTSH